MISASYRLHDSDAPHEGTRVEVVCGLVDEYGQQMPGGGYQTWDTAPRMEKIWPLEQRIEGMRQQGKVYRRRIIVVEDWTEVDAP